MVKRCSFIYSDGKPCGRWARPRTKFCYHHQSECAQQLRDPANSLHPLLRLASPEDLFDVVREGLNAVRLGRIAPGQAYALGYMVDVWLRVYKELDIYQREEGLFRQLLAGQVEREAVAKSARADEAPLLPTAEPEPADPSVDEETVRRLTSASRKLKAELNKNMKKAAIAFMKSAVRNTCDAPGEEAVNSGEKKA